VGVLWRGGVGGALARGHPAAESGHSRGGAGNYPEIPDSSISIPEDDEPMSKKKPTPGGRAKKKAEVSLVRSSAAEYLTFVAASGQGGVEAVYADENVWLTQKMMGLLYDVETHTVNYHLKKVFDDSELSAGSVIRNFRITAADGKSYDTQHYNLSAIIEP
jgi:hypothetical protein